MSDEIRNEEELENTENENTIEIPENSVIEDSTEEPTGDKEPVEEPTEEPIVQTTNEEENEDDEKEKKSKATAAYIALRYLGVTPPSL